MVVVAYLKVFHLHDQIHFIRSTSKDNAGKVRKRKRIGDEEDDDDDEEWTP